VSTISCRACVEPGKRPHLHVDLEQLVRELADFGKAPLRNRAFVVGDEEPGNQSGYGEGGSRDGQPVPFARTFSPDTPSRLDAPGWGGTRETLRDLRRTARRSDIGSDGSFRRAFMMMASTSPSSDGAATLLGSA
jgi:hypothetical protein